MDKLLDFLGNAHFEAYVAGPLIGGIVGICFAALGNRAPPRSHGHEERPSDVRIELKSTTTVTHHHHYHQPSRPAPKSDDFFPIFLLGGLASLVAIFFFAAYLPTIANVFAYAILTIAAFATALCLTALIGQRYTTWEWWLNALAPLVILSCCYYVLTLARASIGDNVIAFANSLRDQHPRTFQGTIAGAFSFAKLVGNDYVQWMILEMAAFMNLLFITVVCALQCIHYLALANFRDGRDGWRWLALNTERFGKASALALASLFLIVSALLANGNVYQWLH